MSLQDEFKKMATSPAKQPEAITPEPAAPTGGRLEQAFKQSFSGSEYDPTSARRQELDRLMADLDQNYGFGGGSTPPDPSAGYSMLSGLIESTETEYRQAARAVSVYEQEAQKLYEQAAKQMQQLQKLMTSYQKEKSQGLYDQIVTGSRELENTRQQYASRMAARDKAVQLAEDSGIRYGAATSAARQYSQQAGKAWEDWRGSIRTQPEIMADLQNMKVQISNLANVGYAQDSEPMQKLLAQQQKLQEEMQWADALEPEGQLLSHDERVTRDNMRIIDRMTDEEKEDLYMIGMLRSGKPQGPSGSWSAGALSRMLQKGYDKEKLYDLGETWVRVSNQKTMEDMQTEAAEENPWLGNAAAIPMNLVGAITGTEATLQEMLTNKLGGSQYEQIDANNPGYAPGVYAGQVRQTSKEEIRQIGGKNGQPGALGKALGAGYGGLTSAVDSGVRIAAFGPASLALAGMGSFQETARDVIQRGGTNDQAMLMGLAAGTLEVVTEKVSLDNLIKMKAPVNLKQLGKNLGIQGLIEASEEEAGLLGNLAADALIMADKSELNQAIRDYMAQGMSKEEATRKAWKDVGMEALATGIESALSGGMMASAESAVKTVQMRNDLAQRVKNAQLSTEEKQAYIDEALAAKEGTDARNWAEKLRKKGITGEKITDRQLGILWEANIRAEAAGLLGDEEAAAEVQQDEESAAEVQQEETEDNVGTTEEDVGTTGQQEQAQPQGLTLRAVDETAGTENKAGKIQTGASQEGMVTQEEYNRQIEEQDQQDSWAESALGSGQLSQPEYDGEMEISRQHREQLARQLNAWKESQKSTQQEAPEGLRLGQVQEDQARAEEELLPGIPMNPEMKGTVNNGKIGTAEAGTEGTGIYDGSQERDAGPGPGKQAGTMGVLSGAPGRESDAQAQRRNNRSHYKSRLRQQGEKAVSAKDLGLKTGTERKQNYEIPQDMWDEDIREAAKAVQDDAGLEAVFVTGEIQVTGADDQLRKVRAVNTGDKVIIRADHSSVMPQQLADHEIYHTKSARMPALNKYIRKAITEQYSEEEFEEVLGKYIGAMAGVYDVDGISEDARNIIAEEAFADAYAGINAFGAHADKFTETVNKTMDEMYVGKARRQDNGTRQTRGPDRYSYAGKKSETADLEALQEAKELESADVDPEIIRQQTGWFRGMEGMWRYEIDDSSMEVRTKGDANLKKESSYREYDRMMDQMLYGNLKEEEYQKLQELDKKWNPMLQWMQKQVRDGGASLSDILIHDELFRAYPRLKKTTVEIGDTGDARGYYDPKRNTIRISSELAGARNLPQFERTLAHEIQHAIQSYEGFSKGASSELWARIRENLKNEAQDLKDEMEEYLNAIGYKDHVRENVQKIHAGEMTMRQHWQDLEDFKNSSRFGEEIQDLQKELDALSLQMDSLIPEEGPFDTAQGNLYWNTEGEIEARDTEARKDLTAAQRKTKQPNLQDESWRTEDYQDYVYSVDDEDYMAAVKSGNMEEAQRMVDQAAKDAGYDLNLYHQTASEFTKFNTNHEFAGRSDTDTPTGFFFKPTDKNIGLQGDTQMHVFVKAHDLLEFRNRDEIHKYWMENVKGYRSLQEELDALDKKYDAMYEEAEEASDEWYEEHYDDYVAGRISYTEVMEHTDAPLGKILDEWKAKENPIRAEMKKLVTEYMHGTKYDGIHLVFDGRRAGVDVETYIVFDPARIKSAEPVTYSNSGEVIPLSERFSKDPDIRYSTDDEDSDGNELSPQQAEFFKDSKVRDEQGRLRVMYHGTTQAGFTVFDPSKSDDKRSLFFSDNKIVADSYGGGNGKVIDANKFPALTAEAFNRKQEAEGSSRRILKIDGETLERLRNPDQKLVQKLEKEATEAIKELITVCEKTNGRKPNQERIDGLKRYKEAGWYENHEIIQGINGALREMTNPFRSRNKDVTNAARDVTESLQALIGNIYKGAFYFTSFKSGKYVLMENEETPETDEMGYMISGTEEELLEHAGEVNGNKYAVYLNLQNPLIIDNKKQSRELTQWNGIEYQGKVYNTRELALYAKENGYDGVLLSDMADMGKFASRAFDKAWKDQTKPIIDGRELMRANIAIAFSPEQVKSIDNLDPTSDPDIRYSTDEDETIREADEQTLRELEAIDVSTLDPLQAKQLEFDKAEARAKNEARRKRQQVMEEALGAEGVKEFQKDRQAKEEREKAERKADAKTRRDQKYQDLRRQKARVMSETKAQAAKGSFRKNVMSLFSIGKDADPDTRKQIGGILDSFADQVIQKRYIAAEDRKWLLDQLYNAGVMRVPADEVYQIGREYVTKGRIYVPESVKADFGDDWKAFRSRAFGSQIYLTSDRSAGGIDQWNQELAGILPGLFDSEETDARVMLERIVDIAEEGKDEKMSLPEYTAMLAGQDYITENEFLDDMERKLDNSIRVLEEGAELEKKLNWKLEKDRYQRAIERNRHRDAMERAQEQKELKALQQKTLKSLQWLSQNRHKAPEDLRNKIDDALSDIDILAVGAANAMNYSPKYGDYWENLVNAIAAAKKADPMFEPSDDLKDIQMRLEDRKLEDMTVEQLRDLLNMAVGIRTEMQNRKNIMLDEENRMFEDVYPEIKRGFQEADTGFDGKIKFNFRTGKIEFPENAGQKPGASKIESFFNDSQLTPMNVMQRMVGWDPDNPFYSIFAKQLEKGERDMRAYRVKAERMLESYLRDHKEWIKRADGQGKDGIWYKVEVPVLVSMSFDGKPVLGNTETVWMTPMMKVHMYLESKNMDNLTHMEGGRTFADKEIYKNGNREDAFSRGKTIKLAPDTVRAMVKDLTPEEKELAAILEKYYNGMAREEINKVSNAVDGFDKAIGKNYAPIFSNQNYVRKEVGKTDTTASGVGSLKKRDHGRNATYQISALDAFERNVDDLARYVGMTIPEMNWNRLMNYGDMTSSMRDVITHKWGEKGTQYLDDLLVALGKGTKAEREIISTMLGEMQSSYISAVFGATPSIVFKQLGSIPMAAPYLGLKNRPSASQIRNIDRSLINTYTQELEWRTMGYSIPETKQLKDNPRGIWDSDAVRKISGTHADQVEKAGKFLFEGDAIVAMDGWAASTLWPWAENKVRNEHPELAVGTEEQIRAGESPFYKKVAEEFDNAVSRSQSVSDEIHQSTMRKSRNPVTKAFTMFKSDSAQTYNALRQKAGEMQFYKRTGNLEKARQARKELGAVIGAALLNNTWAALITFAMAFWKRRDKRYRNEEGELTAASIALEAMDDAAENLMGIIAGGEELYGLIGNILTGKRPYDIDTPGISQLNDALKTAEESFNELRPIAAGSMNILKNGGDLGAYLRKHGADLLGVVKRVAVTTAKYSGIPAENLEAYLIGAIGHIAPEAGIHYDDTFRAPSKANLAGLTGKRLEGRMEDILRNRGIRLDRRTIRELAAEYAAGNRWAFPGDVPNSVSIHNEDRKLSAIQAQTYDIVWGRTVGENLDELIGSDDYQKGDTKTRQRILDRLYDHAAALAKAELFDDYELTKGMRESLEMIQAGVSLNDLILWDTKISAEDENGKRLKSGEKAELLRKWKLPDSAKKLIFQHDITESYQEKLPKILAAGVSFDKFLRIYSEYNRIDNTDQKAGGKALEFARWLDGQGLSKNQTDVVKENLKFFGMMPVDAGKYDKYTASGLTSDEAYQLTEDLEALEPEEGQTDVSTLQKWRVSVDFSDDERDQLAALSMVMSDSQMRKCEMAGTYGISPRDYVNAQETKLLYDEDGNGSYKQSEIQAALDSLQMSNTQRAVLWQLMTGSKSAKKNPYSTAEGQRVIDLLASEKEKAEESGTFSDEVMRQLTGGK